MLVWTDAKRGGARNDPSRQLQHLGLALVVLTFNARRIVPHDMRPSIAIDLTLAVRSHSGEESGHRGGAVAEIP
jgi:hypothetical protein